MDESEQLSREEKDLLLKVSRHTLINYLSGSKPPDFKTKLKGLLINRPAFVTLRNKKTNELRGCRGEIQAKQPLIESVMKMTITSATNDPRFLPVTLDEIPQLKIEINALTPMYAIKSENVVIGKHGLMIVADFNAGLLLPQVPVTYNWTSEQYLQELCYKAGLPKNSWQKENIELYAFESEEFAED